MLKINDILVPLAGNYIRLRTHVWRPQEPTATLVCLHDYIGDTGDFFLLAESLCAAGIKVVAADMPGRSESGALHANEYGLPLYHACINQLYQLCERRCMFLGSGWGGAIALTFLASARVKFHALALHDPLVSSSAFYHRAVSITQLEAGLVFANRQEAEGYVLGTRAGLLEAPEPIRMAVVKRKIRETASGFEMSWDRNLIAEYNEKRVFNLSSLVDVVPTPMLLMTSDEFLALEGDAWIPHHPVSRRLVMARNSDPLGNSAVLRHARQTELHAFIMETVAA